MNAHVAFIGIGSNLGDRAGNVERAVAALAELGAVRESSTVYATAPWGKKDQPPFLNAVVRLETELSARALVDAMKAIERRLGRLAGERWGPRIIDLDLLLYDDAEIDEPDLRVPHPQMFERAFVLVPLAELDARFAPLRDALEASELAGVEPWRRETATRMSSENGEGPAARVRALARFLIDGDVARVRIERDDEAIELVRRRSDARAAGAADARAEAAPQRVDTIKADLVGIFHFGRPAPVAGESFDGDREFGFIEALGIRTPVRSIGAGRIVEIGTADGAPVEYGQPLFSVARG